MGRASRKKCTRNKRSSAESPCQPSFHNMAGEVSQLCGIDCTKEMGGHPGEVSGRVATLQCTTSSRLESDTPSVLQEHIRSEGWVWSGQSRFRQVWAMGGSGNGELQKGSGLSDGYNLERFKDLQELRWDGAEAALEALLLKLLDFAYEEAIKAIMSYGYGTDQALSAVLINGCCFGGKDVFTNIVENAMAYLTGKGTETYSRDVIFADLNQLKKHSLADMVCVLRQLRSFLSKEDAMWCLLMCDMNVVQASAMQEFALCPSSDRLATNLSSMPFPQPITSPNTCTAVMNAPFSAKTVAQVPVPTHAGVFLPPGYVMTHVQAGAADSALPLVSLSGSSSQPEKDVSCSKLLLEKLDPPLHPIDSRDAAHCQHTSSLNLVQADGCALHLSQNIERLQRLSLEACSPGMGMNIAQQLSKGSTRAQPESTLSDAHPSTSSSLGPALQHTSLASLDNSSDVGAKMDASSRPQKGTQNLSATQLGVSHSQFRASVDCREVDARDTELLLVTASVVGSEAEQGLEELKTNVNMTASSTSSHPHTLSESSERRTGQMYMELFHQVRELEVQVKERSEWAHQRAMQAACRLGKDMAELKALRFERGEIVRLKKDNQAPEDRSMKRFTEMENALRKASAQVDQANAAVCKLRSENAEVRAEMEAAKLNAAESAATCQEVAKREKKSMKRAQMWEKQKAKLQDEIADEKNRLAQLQQQLLEAKEQQLLAEMRWRQEEKAKVEAVLQAEAERQAREQVEAAARKREEALQRKAEFDFQCHKDDIKRLESELVQLRVAAKVPQVLTAEMASGGIASLDTTEADGLQGLKDINVRLLHELADLQESQRDIARHHECVMCGLEEVSVVFLPCAHQVVCAKCNSLHKNQEMRECPSCNTPIQQRICVFGVDA